MASLEKDRRLSAAVGVSGRRALRELRLLLAAGILTLLGVAIALMLYRAPDTDDRVLKAAAADLDEVSTEGATAMLLLYQWLGQDELLGAEGTAIATDALAAQSDAATAWRHFVARPATLPGEAEARERYQTMSAAAEEWGAQLSDVNALAAMLADPAARAGIIAGSREHTIQRVEALSELRSMYTHALATFSQDQASSTEALRTDVGIAVVSGVGVLLLAFFVLERSGRRRAKMLAEVEALLDAEAKRTRLEGQLGRALEICDDEIAAYRILEAAVDGILDDGSAELLVADSSRAHLAQVARTGDDASCQVTTPADCPAVRRGHTQEFPSATELDACPQLRARGGDKLTTCVPFTVGGNSLGVLHVATPAPLAAAAVTHVEVVVRRTGERVGVARAFAKSQDQARTDPLTGLLNRRSLEDRAREIVESGRPYAVVFADLDHFKTLNDVHGHDAGDRALRLFSRCVSEAVRPVDAAARYGGEEFVLMLPDCDVDGATIVIARLREALEQSLGSGTVPPFTASFGIDEAVGGNLADSVARADAALLAAKRAGRNRSVVWTADLGAGRVDDESVPAILGVG